MTGSSSSTANRVLVCIILVLVTGAWASVLIARRSYIFDDSFITYRYAKNLAQGHGITWNRGEPPTEGYTNPLLVAVLAPFIRLGLHPLGVTRVLSVIFGIGTALLCVVLARQFYGTRGLASALVFAVALPAGSTSLLSTLGMETIVATFFLFLGFLCAVRFMETRSLRPVSLFAAAQLCAFLLRPEALILAFVFVVHLLIAWRRLNSRVIVPASVFLLCLAIPLAAYFAWKQAHFGALLPNPFYIKVANVGGLFASRGLESVLGYLIASSFFLALCLFSALISQGDRSPRLLACLFCLAHILFFARTDTLMDAYHRFIYPVTPFLVFLALPAITRLAEQVLASSTPSAIKVPAIALAFALVFIPDRGEVRSAAVDMLRGKDRFAHSEAGGHGDIYQVGRALAEYSEIRDLRIAMGDCGAIPYLTEAYVIDTVGLNDSFIARERDIDRLTDYVFSQAPDLFFMKGTEDHAVLAEGHGPLGDRTKWSNDPRFDAYEYVGTITLAQRYDYHLLLRSTYPDFDDLSSFIQQHIADVVYDPFPLPFGTRHPS